MEKDNLQKFLINAIKKLQKSKGQFNATIDKDIDQVINDLKKSIQDEKKYN